MTSDLHVEPGIWHSWEIVNSFSESNFMTRQIVVLSVLAAATLPLSCASNHGASSRSSAQTAARETMEDDYETPPPRTSISEVMRSKLAHSQAILEGLAMGDMAQIETNALALKRISQGGEWLTQDSPAYFAFSAEFREICDDLYTHAQAKNLQAVAGDYSHLTNSCVACHEYLRREREVKDIPGRISLVEPMNDSVSTTKGIR